MGSLTADREELRRALDALGQTVRGEVEAARTDLRARIETVRAELHQEMARGFDEQRRATMVLLEDFGARVRGLLEGLDVRPRMATLEGRVAAAEEEMAQFKPRVSRLEGREAAPS